MIRRVRTDNRLTSIILVSFLVIGGFVGFVNFESENAQGTNVSGIVYDGSGGPWTPAGSPYIVIGDVTVPAGETLTIEPGVDVKFDGYHAIYVDGNLNAIGTKTNRINITSNKTAPAPKDWNRIHITFAGHADIKYTDISYGTFGLYLCSPNNNITNSNIFSHNKDGIYLDELLFDPANNSITNNDISSNKNSGIHLYRSYNNNITSNNVLDNKDHGILIEESFTNNIKGNNISSNGLYGIYLQSSRENYIIGNNISSNQRAIYLGNSRGNSILDNTVSNNTFMGIYLVSSDENMLTTNSFSYNSGAAIYLDSSTRNNLTGNVLVKSGILIKGNILDNWNTHNIDTSNTVNGKPVYYWKNQVGGTIPPGAGQVILANCTNIIVENQELTYCTAGIQLGFSSNCDLTDNNASSNYGGQVGTQDEFGIYLYHSSGNNLTGNNASNNEEPIYLEFSNWNNITGNTVIGMANGMSLGIDLHFSSNNNSITSNYVSRNQQDIRLYGQSNDNNIMSNYVYTTGRYGIVINSCDRTTVTDNTIFLNYSRINLYNTGISVGGSSSNDITDNTIFSNNHPKAKYGIRLAWSNLNTLKNNTIFEISGGSIYLESSSYNKINGNHVSNNMIGINLSSSTYNNVKGNNVLNNEDGIYLESSSSNSIYHNNIIDNTNQSYDDSNNGNQWDNGYPSGGNYWSDFDEPGEGAYDNYRGSNQDDPISGDGIVDQGPPSGGMNPYVIDINSQDNYPLIDPADTTPPTITNLQPPDVSKTNDNTPMISADYSDLSGIDVISVVLEVDGIDVSLFSIVTANGVSYLPGTALSDGIHIVYLEVADIYGNLATVTWSFTVDTLPPIITNLQPPDTSTTNDNTPTISADYSDASGIDVNSVVLMVDGINVTSFATVTASDVSYIPLMALPDGIHTVYLEVKDIGGNLATVTWSFTVEATPPTITNLQPPDGSTTNDNTTVISANYNDPSGINVSSVLLKVDGIDVTSFATITADNVSFIPATELPDGIHTVYLEVRDIYGNLATIMWNFTVDTLAPIITNLQPPDLSTTNNSTPIIAADYNDLSGINVSSVLLEVDGIDVTSFATVTASNITYIPGIALSDGIHTIYLEVKDIYGNLATATWNFTVDTLSPTITNLQPPDLSTTNDSTPTLSADYNDPSGIDVSSVMLEVDSVNVTLSATVMTIGVSYIPSVPLSDGIHTVYLEVKDNAGNLATTTWSFTVDTTPPTITNLQPPDSSTTNDNTTTISADYSDPSGINVSSVLLEVDGMDVTSFSTVTAGGVIYIPGVALSEGLHSVYLEVRDIYGNLATIMWNFTVDTLAPIITNLQPPDLSTINDSTPTLSADYSDLSGINMSSVVLKVDGIEVTSSAVVTASSITYTSTSLTDSVHTVYFEVKDNAGNLATTTWSFTVDSTPPIITDLLPPDASITNDNTTTISADYSDLSGINVSSVVLRVDGIDVTPSATVTAINVSFIPGTELPDGIHTVYLEVKDIYGNRATSSWSFTVDTLSPITTISPDNNIIKVGTIFTLTATDGVAGCGVDYTQYKIDDGNWVDYLAHFSIGTYGYHNITYRSIDNLGNTESDKKLSIYVPEIPITSLNIGTPQYGTTPRYVNQFTQFSLSVIDYSGTGYDTYYYIDSSPWILYIGPFTVSNEGAHTIYYYSIDNLGNIEDTKQIEIIVDNTPPTTDIVIGDPNYVLRDIFITSVTEFTLSTTDEGLIPVGVDFTNFRIWNGVWSDWDIYPNQFTLGVNDGIRYVEFYGVDLLGNIEPINNRTYIVDNTPPTTTILFEGPSYRQDPENILNVTSETTFVFSVFNGGEYPVKFDSIEYRIWNNGTWSDWFVFSGAFDLGSESGTRYIEWFSADKLGNKELTHNLTVFVDNIPPTTEYILQLESDNSEARISLIPNDIGSGTAFTKYKIDNLTWNIYSNTFVLNEPGSHTVYFYAEDNLENTEEQRKLTVLIEEPEQSAPPTDDEKDANNKPLIAFLFAIILLVVGTFVSMKKPLKKVKENKLSTWLLVVLPFVVAEAATGVISFFTGILSVPPLIGPGMVVDLTILIAGLIVFMVVYRKSEQMDTK